MIKRPTLASLIEEKTGMKVYEFSAAVGISQGKLRTWYMTRHIALALLIAGYEREVMRKEPGASK